MRTANRLRKLWSQSPACTTRTPRWTSTPEKHRYGLTWRLPSNDPCVVSDDTHCSKFLNIFIRSSKRGETDFLQIHTASKPIHKKMDSNILRCTCENWAKLESANRGTCPSSSWQISLHKETRSKKKVNLASFMSSFPYLALTAQVCRWAWSCGGCTAWNGRPGRPVRPGSRGTRGGRPPGGGGSLCTLLGQGVRRVSYANAPVQASLVLWFASFTSAYVGGKAVEQLTL